MSIYQSTTRQRIVVAVDGSTAARQAVLWAADEACRREGELVITQVSVPGPELSGQQDDLLQREEMLAAAAEAASARAPGVPVATLMLRGDVIGELVKLSRSVSLLVVGVDPSKPSRAHHVLGPLEDRLSGRARCPIVAVPASRRSVHDSRADVVVLWTTTDPGRRALRAAAEEADVRCAALTVVSVLPAVNVSVEPSADDAATSFNEGLTTVEQAFPEVFLNVVHESGDVVSTLMHHAQSAALLVIASPIAENRRIISTGPVVRSLLREAPCPVMLVGRMAADLPRPNTALERAEASISTVSGKSRR